MSSSGILLVRHGEIDPTWHGRCCGRSDAALSEEGVAQSISILKSLRSEPICAVFSSRSSRASFLANRVAAEHGLKVDFDDRLYERDFGDWEGELWDDIWNRVGDQMNGLVDCPQEYRPGGGETTFELRDRAMSFFRSLPLTEGLTVVITHGGVIASIRGSLESLPVAQWYLHIPKRGETVMLERIGCSA